MMSRKWAKDGKLSSDPLLKKKYMRRFTRMLFAIMGAAGTGKTSVVNMAEALQEIATMKAPQQTEKAAEHGEMRQEGQRRSLLLSHGGGWR